jgi:hypothetical protein
MEENEPAFLVPNTGEENARIVIQPATYCTLGHYHLHIEEYDKGT